MLCCEVVLWSTVLVDIVHILYTLVLCTDLHCVHNAVCASPSAEDASLWCASSILQVWRMEGFDDNGCRCKLLDGHQVLHLATAASICFLQSTALPASDLVQTHVGLNFLGKRNFSTNPTHWMILKHVSFCESSSLLSACKMLCRQNRARQCIF